MKNIKEIKKSKGITLISLVVTIILMIILAGISIVLLFGEQGIITRAKEQKEIQIQGEILEQFELQKTDVLDYNTLYTDLKVYLNHIQANGLGAYKVTNREYIDKSNAAIVWVDGKYKYKVSQVDNNVVINAEGKVGNLKPEIKEFKVINTTTNTIEVEVKAILGKKYTITIEDNGKVVDSYEVTKQEKKTNEEEIITHIFEGVAISNNEYGYTVKVVVENKVGKTEKEILANTIELPDPNFTFEKSTSDWTNENVTVKAIVNNEEAKKYILKTSKDGENWDNTDTQTFETNGVMYAIITDGTNITDIATAQVTNIDNLPPNEFTPEITEIKTRSLTVKATVDDAEATEEDGKSGIAEYRFSKDNGSTWTAYQAENSYKFDELEQTKEYTIKVEVKDRAGNTTVGTKSTNTDTIPAGNFTFTKSTNNWTNGNITVTVGTSITGYTLQTCKDGVSWANTNQQTLTTNGTVYARLTDGVNVNAVGTGPVTNIDKTAPGGTSITYNGGSNSCSWKNNYNLTLSSSDSQSGVSYYEIDWSGDGNANTTTGWNFIPWNGWHACNTRFRAVDAVGNKGAWTEGQHIHMDTQAPTQVTMNLNGYSSGAWTNGNVTQTASASDNVGIAYYQYSHNGSSVAGTFPNPWTINWDGQWNFYVRAVDHAGNAGAWSNVYTIRRDTVPPSAPSIDITNASMSPSGWSFDIWTGGASDNVGIAYYQYTINGGATFSSSHIAGSGGFDYGNYVRVRAVGHAKNAGPWSSSINMNAKRLYIRQLYKAIRNAPGTESEVDYWERSFAPATIAAAFFASPEVEQNYLNSSLYNYIDRCYIGIFGRTSDSGGNSYYQSVFNRYGTRREAFGNLLPALINSAESQNLYNNNGLGASTTNYDEVVALYNIHH